MESVQEYHDAYVIDSHHVEYNIPRGSLQSLQTLSCSFAGMISVFCSKLGWHDMELLVLQFMDRLNFAVQMDILPLVQIPHVKSSRARALYSAGYKTVAALAAATTEEIESVLHNAVPFKSKKHSGEEKHNEGTTLQHTDCVEYTHKVEARIAKLIIAGAKSILGKGMSIDDSVRELTQQSH